LPPTPHPKLSLPLPVTLAVFFATALCAIPRVASAAPPKSAGPRKGLYLRAGIGPDVMSGKVSYSASSAVGGTASKYVYEAGFNGAGADVDLAAGWAPLDGLAIALEGRAILQMTGSAKLPHTTLSYLSLQSLGGLVQYYPFPRGPVHVDFGAGYARTEYASEEDAVLSPRTIVVHADDMSGVLAHAGVGYDWRARMGFQVGPVLDAWETRLSSKEGRTTARGVSLLIAAGWL
jgi:hypothetical protein